MSGRARPRAWCAEEDAILREFYPLLACKHIAAALRRPEKAVYQHANAIGLSKPPGWTSAYNREHCRDNGKRSRFQPGLVPWNKGAKGLRIGGESTQFKPGSQPFNTQPVGSHRVTKDGSLQRKVGTAAGSNSKRWRGVHELVWVELNGPVPSGHIVVFKPGQRTAVLEEITSDRVECISLAENMRRNTLHRYPKEIALAMQMRGALNRRIQREQQDDR
jgi:hypothetical protein